MTAARVVKLLYTLAMKRLSLATLLVCVAGIGSTAFASDVSQMTLPIAPLSEPVAMILFASGLIVLASHIRHN